MLWFALHLNALPLEALLDALPAEPRAAAPPPRCVVDQRRVLLADAAARAAGVQPGMSAASAAALLPGLQCLPRDAARESAFVERLALALGRFSPALVIEPCTILIEVSASLRLFGGARALAAALRQAARDSGVRQLQTAAAPTATAASLLACAAASPGPATASARRRSGSPDRTAAPTPAAAASALDSRLAWQRHIHERLDVLPLGWAMAAWGLPERTTALLQGIGCRTLADVRALPRAGLQRRGGAALLERLAQAYGEAPDPRPWFEPPPGFEIGLELLHRADDAAMLVFAAERLLQPLAGWLAQQWLAASRIALHLRHESSRRERLPDTVVRIGLGEASRDARHLGLLLRERLQRTELPAPVYALTLRLEEAVSHAGREAALWRDAQRGEDGVRSLIDRLGARLGPERVLRLHLQADHRPERAMGSRPASREAPAGTPVLEAPHPPRPTWLLPEPLRLAEHGGRPLHGGPLVLRSRAERIEAGWFDGEAVSRDYHVAEGRDHRLRWIFRERRGEAAQWSQWYLHGLFG